MEEIDDLIYTFENKRYPTVYILTAITPERYEPRDGRVNLPMASEYSFFYDDAETGFCRSSSGVL